ncbi:MAG: RimK/LysX family protein [Patescibacteria group bacterium]|nr:RimK/LysX family protein [Patescibacteria group bacterium]
MTAPIIVGSFELVSFPDLGIAEVVAKVDTGAYSGTVHATNITETTDPSGDQILEFYPLGKAELKTHSRDYTSKQIRSSNGQLETRFVINTKIILQGQEYPISISLADRSAMMKSVLIGRQFLRRQRIIVDVRQGTQYAYAVKEAEL